jgi:hypothetical protein
MLGVFWITRDVVEGDMITNNLLLSMCPPWDCALELWKVD